MREVLVPTDGWRGAATALRAKLAEAERLLNTPELHDFAAGVVREAAHQRERWGSNHDAGKTPEDWFWLLGYLSGKILRALAAGDKDKALHHAISSSAALANWHAAIQGSHTAMRPGVSSEKQAAIDAATKDAPNG